MNFGKSWKINGWNPEIEGGFKMMFLLLWVISSFQPSISSRGGSQLIYPLKSDRTPDVWFFVKIWNHKIKTTKQKWMFQVPGVPMHQLVVNLVPLIRGSQESKPPTPNHPLTTIG